MKKLVLFIAAILIIGCSKDDNGDTRSADPLIGTWLDSVSNYTYNFKSNGRFTTSEAVCISDGVEISADLFWAANEENPDFSQVRREYRFTVNCADEEGTEIFTAVFSDDFNSLYFVGTDFNGVRQ